MTLAFIGMILSLALLITLAYRGHSVVVVAPLAATVAVLFAGAPLLASYTQVFMPALAGFIAAFFPLFIVGAIFGQLMTVSGLAGDLAAGISRLVGAKRALLATILATSLLTYGGVSAWVIVFTMFPIATILFRLADIPRRLMPAAIALGIFTFTTAALPGSPQIHNAIPTRYFETTTFAAPGLGLIGALVVFTLGWTWLQYRQRRLTAAGESFSDLTEQERSQGLMVPGEPVGHLARHVETDRVRGDVSEDAAEGHDWSAEASLENASLLSAVRGALPVVLVTAVNALLIYALYPRMNFDYLAEDRYGATTIQAVAGVWAVVIGLTAAIILILLMRPSAFRSYLAALSTGAKNAVLPVFTTASEVGYGAVIASLAAFAVVRDSLVGVSDSPVVLSITATSVISGLTGSASGGLTITLETFGEQLRQMALDQGVSLELLHRVTAMASTGLDSLPHNGAIITLLLVCGLTHRESYKDIGVVTVLVPLVGVALVAVLGSLVGAF